MSPARSAELRCKVLLVHVSHIHNHLHVDQLVHLGIDCMHNAFLILQLSALPIKKKTTIISQK